MTDRTLAPNTAGVGIAKSLQDETGAGRGDIMTGNSSIFIINRDPFRSIRRGRQLFQRKFTRLQGQGEMKGMVWGTSIRIMRLGPDSPTVVRCATGAPRCRRDPVATLPPGEMGIEVNDPDLTNASAGLKVVTPAGMVLDGTQDKISPPPAPDAETGQYEMDPAIVDHLEFYLLNYFKAGLGKQDDTTARGRRVFNRIGCSSCHVADLQINHDRRVADLETDYDPVNGNFNNLFATATALIKTWDDGSGYPALKQPQGNPFLVKNVFTDFKRHDLGPNLYERNYDGTLQKQFLTRALWGAGSTAPYGHDGRSMTLDDVILRHGGESQASRDAYARLTGAESDALQKFLNSLMLFPPDDTASTLDPGNRSTPNFPQFGHGSIKLTVLFNDPSDPE